MKLSNKGNYMKNTRSVFNSATMIQIMAAPEIHFLLYGISPLHHTHTHLLEVLVIIQNESEIDKNFFLKQRKNPRPGDECIVALG